MSNIPRINNQILFEKVYGSRIMIVDDDELILSVIRKYLQRQGYDCHTFTDSEKALDTAQDVNPDLIILDYMMPTLDGFEFCNLIKLDPAFKFTPIVFITASEDNSTVLRAFDAGAVDYIMKPINTRELVVRIRTHLELAHSRIQLEKYAHEMEIIAEERARQLIHADRLATLGTLAAGVAHEINNPTTFISGNIQTLKKFWEIIDPVLRSAIDEEHEETQKLQFILDETPQLVEGMRNGVSRIHKIVSSLRTFARKEVVKKKPFHLRVAIDNALELTKNAIKKAGMNIVLRPGDGDVIIDGDQQQIEQVLVNLIVNASDALMGCPEPRLKISLRMDAAQAHLLLEDNGPGIEPGVLEKIWNPFFTTKEPGKGTGLGLSISRSIIRSHGGVIEARNTGNGLRFHITLPVKTVDPGSLSGNGMEDNSQKKE